MNWRCPNCGNENEDTTHACAVCNYIKIAEKLILEGDSGKSTVKIDTNFNKQLLRQIVGDDYRFASDPQFHVSKKSDCGAWVIEHNPGAINPTFCNGFPVGPEGSPLKDGDIISIGAEKARMSVKLEW